MATRSHMADGQRHPQVRADRISSALAGDWARSREQISSRQTQRDLSAGSRREGWLASSAARCELHDTLGSADPSRESEEPGHARRESTRCDRLETLVTDVENPRRPYPWRSVDNSIAVGID
jgi:hypothetical protein